MTMKVTVVLLAMLWTTCQCMDVVLERLERIIVELERRDSILIGDDSDELSDRAPIDLLLDEPSIPLPDDHEVLIDLLPQKFGFWPQRDADQDCLRWLSKLTHKEQSIWWCESIWFSNNFSEDRSFDEKTEICESEESKKLDIRLLEVVDEAYELLKMRLSLRALQHPLVRAGNPAPIAPFGNPFSDPLALRYMKEYVNFVMAARYGVLKKQTKVKSLSTIKHGDLNDGKPLSSLVCDEPASLLKTITKPIHVSKKLNELERLVCLNRASNRWKMLTKEYKSCWPKSDKVLSKKNNLKKMSHHLKQPKKR